MIMMSLLSAAVPSGGTRTLTGTASKGQGPVPSHPLAGGGSMPMMIMGGNDYAGWFKAAGKGAGIQTFYSYGNGRHIAPQLKSAGRENVFVSSGIPCGCCGPDSVKKMNASLAMNYINKELSELDTTYVDLLLVHHRCTTDIETASLWSAFEAAKAAGKARHIGVSNFNAHDLATLGEVAKEPIEALEAHFGVGAYGTHTHAHSGRPQDWTDASRRLSHGHRCNGL